MPLPCQPVLLLSLCLLLQSIQLASGTSVSHKLPDDSQLQRLARHNSWRSRNLARSSPFIFNQNNREYHLLQNNELYNLQRNETLSRPSVSRNNDREVQENHHMSIDEPISYGRPHLPTSSGRAQRRAHRHVIHTRRSNLHTRPRPPDSLYPGSSRRHRPRYHSRVQHNRKNSWNNNDLRPARIHHRQHSSGNNANSNHNTNENHTFRNQSAQHTRRSYHFFYPPPAPLLPQTSRVAHRRDYYDPNYHPIPPLQIPHLLHTAPSRLHPTVHLSPSPQFAKPVNNILPQEPLQARGQSFLEAVQSSRNYLHSNNRRSSSTNELTDQKHCSNELRVGKALNIFSRYGFLTLSVKVRPPVGEESCLFLENTAEVFQKNSYWGKREVRRHKGDYDDHFYIHFCENLNELLLAYFNHFTIEGVPKAHKAFTSSLSVRDLARQFGINSSFLSGHFSFVLVRLFRRKKRSTLKGPLEMEGSLKKALESVRVGSTESVHQFVDRFGSHVIAEFEVGDMMYQTFVFGERLYKELQNKFAVVTSENHLEELQQYFTPNYATNVGDVLLASGNNELSTILERVTSPELLLYPNIFKLFDNPDTEEELEKLDGEVVLSLKLDKITSRLPFTPETRWMSEVLDNTLAVYYEHLASTRKNS